MKAGVDFLNTQPKTGVLADVLDYQLLEKNNFKHLVTRNYLGNTLIVTDSSGSHGV